MEILIHQLWRYSEPTEHFNAEVPKVGVSTKDRAHYHEEGCVHRRHYYDGADSVGPWSYFFMKGIGKLSID